MTFSVIGQWIFDIFMGFVYTLWGYLIADAFLDQKTTWQRRWHLALIISLGLMQAIVARWNLLNFSGERYAWFAINILTALTMYCLVMLPFTGGFFKKLFVLGIILVVLVLSELIMEVIIAYTGQSSLFKDNIPLQLLHIMIQCALSLGIRFLRRGRKLGGSNPSVYKIRIIVPIVSVITLSILNDNAIRAGYLTRNDVVFIFSILLIDIITYIVFESMDRIYQKNQEYALQEQQHKLREEYYSRVEQHQREIRTIKHDLKNQFTTLSGYLSSGEPEKAAAEIAQITGHLSQNTWLDFSEHPGLNALLGSKYASAEGLGILCEFDVSVPMEMGISDNDIAATVGNVLDNAIEACLYCRGRRYISLKLVYFGSSLILSCDNSADGGGMDRNKKKDKLNHGLGLYSIEATAHKYYGDVKYNHDGHSFHIELTMFTNHDGKQPKA